MSKKDSDYDKNNNERLVRIEERLKSFREMYERGHEEVLQQMKGLVKHVNDEQAKCIARIELCEKYIIAEQNRYKGRIELLKWVSTILGITISILVILHYFKLF